MSKKSTQQTETPTDQPADPPPNPPRTKKVSRNLQYNFTPEEKVELGKELGEAVGHLGRLESDRKMVADEWKAKISAQEAEVNSLGNKCRGGYEYRDMLCTVTFHDPIATKKTIRRDDNGEIVEVRYMEEFELQEELRFEESEKAALDAPAEPAQ